MKLDNTTIYIGSLVYDLAFGQGSVTSITLGHGFQVRFDSGYESGYNENGVGQFPNRTLFNCRPEIFTPFNDSRDIVFGRIMRAVRESIEG